MVEGLFVLQTITAVAYVGYLIHRYTMPQVNIFVRLIVYATWLLSFSIVFLLPYDAYYTLQEDNAMTVVWKTNYFAISILTWVLLPIAQQFELAGEFTTRQRLKRAVVSNLISYGVMGALGAVFLVYIKIKGSSLDDLLPLAVTASNVFGMALVVILLSYGLVAVPRALWREKKYQMKLKQRQFTASALVKKKSTLMHELELKVKEVIWLKNSRGQTPQTVKVLALVPDKLVEQWQKNVPDLGTVDIITLHKAIKNMTNELVRLQNRWEALKMETFQIEDIISNMNSPERRISSTLFPESRYQYLNLVKWLWNCRVKLVLIPALAILFAIFAAGIVIAELSVFVPYMSTLNVFRLFASVQSFFIFDMGLCLTLAYIVFCVYFALFKLKFAGFYGLYWNRQTDAPSLIFFAINCSRVSNPLGYNFLQVIDNRGTSFETVMGQSSMLPVVGQAVHVVFPVLLILLIVFNSLDVYGMLARWFGLQKFVFVSDFSHQNIEDGRKLLQRARVDLENKVLNSNKKSLSEFTSYKQEFIAVSRDRICEEEHEYLI